MEILKLKELKNNKTTNIKMLLFGESYIGKTTLASTFPKPLIISTDGNVKGLDSINEDAEAIIINDYMDEVTDSGDMITKSGWETFKKIISNIDSLPYETIVVDIIKDIHEFCRAKILKKIGVEHESEDNRMGRVWNMLDTEFLPVLRKLMTSNKNVVLITHTKEKSGIIVPDLIDSLTKKLNKYADIGALLINEQDIGGNINKVLISSPEIGKLTGNRLGINQRIEWPTYTKIIEEIERGK